LLLSEKNRHPAVFFRLWKIAGAFVSVFLCVNAFMLFE